MCMRRFIARRGKPKLIVSDNASQLKLGSEIINQIWKFTVANSNVQSYVANEGITWKFTVAHAPWQGGSYERLIGLTKRSIRKALGKLRVSREQLVTLIQEVEAILNNRPLVYIDEDINSEEILTPSHFMNINRKAGIPDIEIEDDDYLPLDFSSTKLLGIWKKGQAHLNRFWNIWQSEYLQFLRERHTINMKPIKGEVTRMPTLNEIVIVKEDGISRGKWKMAKIVNLIESECDGVIRAVELLLLNKRKVRRPLRLVYPLEAN